MLELFHQRYFADGGGWSAFFAVEVDLFERNQLASLAVPTLEDCCIGTFSELYSMLEMLVSRGIACSYLLQLLERAGVSFVHVCNYALARFALTWSREYDHWALCCI
jgi:hypothetical protein